MTLTVTKRLGLGFFALVALTLICQLLASYFIGTMKDDMYEIVEVNARQQAKAVDLLDDTQEIRVLYRQTLLDTTPEARAKTQASFNEARKRLLQNTQELEKLFSNPSYPPEPQEKDTFAKIKSAQGTALAAVEKVLELANAGRLDEARQVITAQALPAMSELTAAQRRLLHIAHRIFAALDLVGFLKPQDTDIPERQLDGFDLLRIIQPTEQNALPGGEIGALQGALCAFEFRG